METFVLIPEQLSLERGGDGRLGVVSNQYISRGTRFSPFQGTLRTDHFGTYERRHRRNAHPTTSTPVAESWIKYLRQTTSSSSPDVNLTEIIIPGGQILYEVRRSIQPLEELVVFVRIESVLSFTRALKDVIFEETLRALILEVPLDLSTSLFNSSTNAKSKTKAKNLLRKSNSKSKTKSEASSDDTDHDHTDTQESDADASTSSSSSSLNLNKALTLEISSKSSSSTSSSITGFTDRGGGSGTKRVRSLLPCGVCAKSFDRPSLLKRHMRTHTGEKPHRCECGKAFSTSSSLNTHRRIHSGEKPHQCPVCGKRFTASSNLYYHRMTHVKEKPHKCLLCGKSFPTPGDLKSHGFIHTGSWPFKCSVCSRGFSKQTNLKNHLFLHTGNKPHGCNLCHKKFALACNFRAHLKTHQEAGSPELLSAYQGI